MALRKNKKGDIGIPCHLFQKSKCIALATDVQKVRFLKHWQEYSVLGARRIIHTTHARCCVDAFLAGDEYAGGIFFSHGTFVISC